jgi:hypothetical protein
LSSKSSREEFESELDTEDAGKEAHALALSAKDRIRSISRATIAEEESEQPELRQSEQYQVLHERRREIRLV